VPAFHCSDGGFVICDTNDGGRWKRVDTESEIESLDIVDSNHGGNVRTLTRMLKQWQRHCNVPIKSFQLEALVKELLPTKQYGKKDWFDWLLRDAFSHLISRVNGTFRMPGCAGELIWLGDAWLSQAKAAHDRALKACTYEQEDNDVLAGIEWQKILGPMIPITAM